MVLLHSNTAPRLTPQFLEGNQTLPLDTSSTGWKIVEGSVGIFAVHWQDNEPVGRRRYLFTAQTGESILECQPKEIGLIAIALEPTRLVPITLASTTPGLSLNNLTSWFVALTQLQGFPKAPAESHPCQEAYHSLRAQQAYRPEEDLAWCRLAKGNAQWLGQPGATVDPRSGVFPVSHWSWLTASSDVELQAFFPAGCDTDNQMRSESLPNLGDPAVIRGIEHFHSLILDLIHTLLTQADEADFQQFQQQQQLNRTTTETTLQGLASLLTPKDTSYLTAESPLLVAAGAAAHALGTAISPPQSSENLAQVKHPLDAIARASHLRLRQVLLRGQWWRQDCGPLVAYTQTDHQPIALLPENNSRYTYLDPVTLETQPVTAELASTLDPQAFMFYRPLPADSLTALGLLRFATQGHHRDLGMVCAMGIALSLLGMVIPQATAVLIDQAIPYGDRSLLIQLGLVLLAVAFGRACFQFAQAIAAMRLETSSDVTLQAAVWDRLLTLPPSFFREYSTGDLQARVSSVNAIRKRLSGTALDAILSGAFALLNLGLLFYYSSRLAVFAVFIALIVMAVTIMSGLVLLKKQRPLLELDGEIYGLVVQLINGVAKLRVFGAEPRAFGQWGQRYQQQLRLEMSTQRLEDAVELFNTAMPTLTTIGIFAIAAPLVNAEGMNLSSGVFLAFSAAFAIFISGATNLSRTVIDVLSIVPLWMRSQPILTTAPEVDAPKADPGRLTGHIALDHVSFRYQADGPMILSDISLTIHPGEFVALVGPSGCGKSTLLRLLLGFEMPESGTLFYDHQDASGLDITAIRRQLGVVLQNGHINAGSLFENISGGALITLEEAWKAANMAGFADDIRNFPMEMHTVVSEGGSNLSGGQRQRLMIARALALNPKILLLDEATSALDNRTQNIVSESLDQLNVTRIVVAHRLSTIRNADRIYVIDAGRIVQQGSFEELAKQPGLFAQLIQRQTA